MRHSGDRKRLPRFARSAPRVAKRSLTSPGPLRSLSWGILVGGRVTQGRLEPAAPLHTAAATGPYKPELPYISTIDARPSIRPHLANRGQMGFAHGHVPRQGPSLWVRSAGSTGTRLLPGAVAKAWSDSWLRAAAGALHRGRRPSGAAPARRVRIGPVPCTAGLSIGLSVWIAGCIGRVYRDASEAVAGSRSGLWPHRANTGAVVCVAARSNGAQSVGWQGRTIRACVG